MSSVLALMSSLIMALSSFSFVFLISSDNVSSMVERTSVSLIL